VEKFAPIRSATSAARFTTKTLKENSNKCGEESSRLELKLRSRGIVAPSPNSPIPSLPLAFIILALLRNFSIFSVFSLELVCKIFFTKGRSNCLRQKIYLA
jgi:hypothetical protein